VVSRISPRSSARRGRGWCSRGRGWRGGEVELHGDHEARAADLGDLGDAVAQGFEALAEAGAQDVGAGAEVLLLDHVEDGMGGGDAEGLPP
jgi:hypothetical protein